MDGQKEYFTDLADLIRLTWETYVYRVEHEGYPITPELKIPFASIHESVRLPDDLQRMYEGVVCHLSYFLELHGHTADHGACEDIPSPSTHIRNILAQEEIGELCDRTYQRGMDHGVPAYENSFLSPHFFTPIEFSLHGQLCGGLVTAMSAMLLLRRYKRFEATSCPHSAGVLLSKSKRTHLPQVMSDLKHPGNCLVGDYPHGLNPNLLKQYGIRKNTGCPASMRPSNEMNAYLKRFDLFTKGVTTYRMSQFVSAHFDMDELLERNGISILGEKQDPWDHIHS